MSAWQIYLFTRVDALKTSIAVASAATTVVLVTFIVMYLVALNESTDMDNANEYRDKWKAVIPARFQRLKLLAPIVLLLWSTVIVIPDQEDIAAIYLIPKLAQSDFTKEAQQIPTDAAKLLRLKLEKWITDLTAKDTKK